MKKAMPFVLVLMAILLTVAACGEAGQPGLGAESGATDMAWPELPGDGHPGNADDTAAAMAFGSFSDLEDRRIWVTTGSIQALLAEERFPDARIYFFSSTADMLNALRAHKIDAFADSDALVKYMMADNPDLTYLDEPLGNTVQVGAIFPKTDKGRRLCEEYSDFIQQIRQEGVYDEIQNTWFGEDESKRAIPDLNHLTATNGTLRVVTDSTVIPFSFITGWKPGRRGYRYRRSLLQSQGLWTEDRVHRFSRDPAGSHHREG